MRRVVVFADAADDIRAALQWYNARREGLGGVLLDEIDLRFRAVAENPQRYPVVQADVRRALLRQFPYSIYFRASSARVEIIAVLHQRRHPASWQKRTTVE